MNAKLEVFDCEQGSDLWYQSRLAIPTASVFHTVLARGKGGGDSITRRKLMLKLIGESLTGQPEESYQNAHMERGIAMEAEARELYALVSGLDPQPVGFLRRGRAGASPDSLVGDDGVLEIKTKLPSLHLETYLSGKMPAEHTAQVQGELWVSGREWCDFVSYWPALPIFITRVYRDEDYIAKLSAAVDEFNAEMVTLTKQILGNGKQA